MTTFSNRQQIVSEPNPLLGIELLEFSHEHLFHGLIVAELGYSFFLRKNFL